MLCQLLCDDLVLMSDKIEELRNKLTKLKEVFESKGLKVNLGKRKIMVTGGITKNGLHKRKDYPIRVCILRAMGNLVVCVQCGKWITSIGAGRKVVMKLKL